jgi:peptide deformylase
MKLKLVEEKTPVLHEELKPIKEITPEIEELISDMKKSMVENEGIGLSANQIGKDLQLFVIAEDLAKEYEAPSVYINPEIKDASKEETFLEEGCLSIPEYFKEIPRSKKIWIKAMDEKGEKHKFKATGFLARVLQHEHDHLSGILIKDKK